VPVAGAESSDAPASGEPAADAAAAADAAPATTMAGDADPPSSPGEPAVELPAAELPAAKVVRNKLAERPLADKPAADKPAAGKPATGKPEKSRSGAGRVEIELEVSRTRALTWAIVGGLIGALLIWKLGTVGVWGGVVLVALAAYHAWQVIQTVLYPPGAVVVTEREVELPRGLCMPRPVKAARSEVTAVYFLRRSVPWNTSAPVLIVELGAKAMAFPRNWFASEAEQRRIVHALLRDKKPAASEPAA
jgi:hypothetical protein